MRTVLFDNETEKKRKNIDKMTILWYDETIDVFGNPT